VIKSDCKGAVLKTVPYFLASVKVAKPPLFRRLTFSPFRLWQLQDHEVFLPNVRFRTICLIDSLMLFRVCPQRNSFPCPEELLIIFTLQVNSFLFCSLIDLRVGLFEWDASSYIAMCENLPQPKPASAIPRPSPRIPFSSSLSLPCDLPNGVSPRIIKNFGSPSDDESPLCSSPVLFVKVLFSQRKWPFLCLPPFLKFPPFP